MYLVSEVLLRLKEERRLPVRGLRPPLCVYFRRPELDELDRLAVTTLTPCVLLPSLEAVQQLPARLDPIPLVIDLDLSPVLAAVGDQPLRRVDLRLELAAGGER